jgi:DNA-binding NarL/FixJ family response regulator
MTPSNVTLSQGAMMARSRPDLCAKLSDAQLAVLSHLLDGLTEPKIAAKIGRSRHTVHDHTKAIYAAMNVNSRVQLVLLFSQPMPEVQMASVAKIGAR